MHFFCAPVSSLSNRYGLPVSSLLKTLHAIRAPPRRRIHFLVVFQNQPTTKSFRSPSKFKVRFMSAQYVKISSCANYERAICQEFAKSSPKICCAMPDNLPDTLLLIFPARSLWLIIIFCYQTPANFFFALLKLYILLWFLLVLLILTFL